jgi:chromosome segregation ATPase
MNEGRRADCARRRQRVLAAIAEALRAGESISVASLARKAGVDRTFFYRHRDLLEQVHAAEVSTRPGGATTEAASRASLEADLAHARERIRRLTGRVRQLEARLSELMGDQAWRESGLGAAADIDELQRRVVGLEQANVDLNGTLEERTAELDAARAAIRELTRSLNQGPAGRQR